MKYSNIRLQLVLLATVLLTACNNGDNADSSNGSLQQFASDNTGDSKEIMTPAVLAQNINSLFGSADSEPIAVNSGDTVSSLIQRNNH